jgi:phage-related protein
MGNLAFCTQEGIGMLTEAASLMENMGINCGPLLEGLQAAQIAAEGMSIAQAALNLVMSLNPIALVTIAIASLVAGLIYLWNTNEDFKNALIGAWNMISEVCSAVWDAIALFFTETLPAALETAVNYFAELPGKIWEFLSQAVGKLGEWASGLISKAGEVLPGVISSVLGFFSGLPDNMREVGKNLIEGIFNGISNSVQWLYEKLKGWAGNVIDYIKGLFEINSPSKVMRDTVGVGIAEGVAVGILENTDLVSDAMSEMADVVTDSDISIEPEVTAKSIDFEAFKEKIRPSLDFVKSQISRAQDVLNTQFAASLQLAGAMAGANNTYNNGNTFNNHYTITASNNSPKATADAIKNQMTMQRMLFATR